MYSRRHIFNWSIILYLLPGDILMYIILEYLQFSLKHFNIYTTIQYLNIMIPSVNSVGMKLIKELNY